MTSPDLDKLIAGNVRAARARARLRQADLADDMGWNSAQVRHLESGSRRITLTDVVALCAALNISLRELLAGAPDDVFQALHL